MSAVSPTSRRIFRYWLLLLVPALVVGFGAIVLLRREQVRLDEQARISNQARFAAIEARARLIAENVELLVGEAESGLMTTLNDVPAANADAFLDEWERTNPLVRATFRLAASERVLRPAAGSVGAKANVWLGGWLARPPWRGNVGTLKESDEDLRKRGDVTWNVSQANSLRSEIQQLNRNSNLLAGAPGQAASAEGTRPKILADAPAGMAKAELPAPQLPEKTGWTPWRDGSGLHLVGWRQAAFGGVIGVEVNLETISSRLGGLLPREGELADALAVRDSGGATVQSKTYARDAGFFASSSGDKVAVRPSVTIPISASVLPGWEVVGFVREGAASSGAGGGFFLAGSLLVAIFVAAIVAGGSLLLRQARRSEEEAVQKTSFVANVSHEFKTPLTTIRLYAELLEQGRVRDAAQGGDYLRTIGRETQRLARLVNNALDFSRLEQGQKKFATEAVDLAAELAALLDTHAPRVAEAGLVLRRDLPATPVVITTDRDALGQIVLNLIDNACKYAAEGGEVLVALAPRAGGGAVVRVADRGPGVPVAHRERIFEKFHRVDDKLTAEKTGAGLGLSIARQLARGLGGELRYVPRAGKGAEFILELP